jgi:hypothetical protein
MTDGACTPSARAPDAGNKPTTHRMHRTHRTLTCTRAGMEYYLYRLTKKAASECAERMSMLLSSVTYLNACTCTYACVRMHWQSFQDLLSTVKCAGLYTIRGIHEHGPESLKEMCFVVFEENACTRFEFCAWMLHQDCFRCSAMFRATLREKATHKRESGIVSCHEHRVVKLKPATTVGRCTRDGCLTSAQ